MLKTNNLTCFVSNSVKNHNRTSYQNLIFLTNPIRIGSKTRQSKLFVFNIF